MRTAPLFALALSALFAPACAVFDGPPEVTIEGALAGPLPDPTLPLVLSFSKTPVASTVKLQLIQAGAAAPFYAYDPVAGDTGGTSAFSVDSTKSTLMTISPTVAPPVGPSLLLLVEPGLSDLAGAVTHAERRIPFSYAPSLTCTKPVSVLRTGTYFFLADVTLPIHVQVQLFGVIDVDPATGAVHSRFTKARRNPDPNRCPTPCDPSQVCRLLPTPMCVAPSTAADSVDQFSDYVPNPDPPTGFSFEVQGCAADQSATTASFATEKVDVQVAMPMVTLRQTQLNASFTPDSDDVLRGTGSLVAEGVLLGIIDSGMGSGDLTARSLTDAQAPTGIPGP